MAVGSTGAPAYCPSGLSRQTDLVGTVLPLQVTSDSSERVVIRGKISFLSAVKFEESDLIRFRLTVAGLSSDFYAASVNTASGLRRVLQFRTWPKTLDARQREVLSQGGRFERCWCEIIPVLSSPYDLYSLSVLGTRALLVHETNPLLAVLETLDEQAKDASDRL